MSVVPIAKGSLDQPSGWWDSWGRLLVVLLACLPSIGTLGAPWVSDDAVILGYVHREGGWIDWFGPQYDLLTIRFWRPIVTASWAIQESLFGVEPLAFRSLNLFCHALTALLVAEIARGLGAGPLAALFAGAMSGLFPEQGGTVTWVAGRVDSLSLPFFVGSLAAVVHGRWLVAACAAFCACACKETAFALPALAFTLTVAGGLSRLRHRQGAAFLAATMACVAAFVWRRVALGAWLGGYPTTEVGLFEAGFQAAAALGDAVGIPFLGIAAVLLAAVIAGSAEKRLVFAGLACAAFAAAPLFALLTDGLLEEQNRRTLAFFDIGIALAVGGAVARVRLVRYGLPVLVLALGLLGWRASLAWRDTHEWAEAGRVSAEAMQSARSAAEKAGPGELPLLAGLLPQHHGGAYALAWGVADRCRAPFEPTARPVWPARPVFSLRPEDERPISVGYKLFPPNNHVPFAFDSERQGSVQMRADGFGTLDALQVDERVFTQTPDRSEAFLFEIAPEVAKTDFGMELVLFTELGYQAFPWDPNETRVSLMQALRSSDGNVSMGDVLALAASVGARTAFLEIRLFGETPQDVLETTGWLRLEWDPDVLDLLR